MQLDLPFGRRVIIVHQKENAMLIVERSGPVAVVTLNRPEAMNA